MSTYNQQSSSTSQVWQTSGKRSAQEASQDGPSKFENVERNSTNSKIAKRDTATDSNDTSNGQPDKSQFSSFPEIHQKTCDILRKAGIPTLFPVQQESFYPLYNREDLISLNVTGSGKTLAFALPIIEKLRAAKTLGLRKIQAIVLCPTRELALQSELTISMLKHDRDEYGSLSVYGGVPVIDQEQKLKGGADIFVGTTGRVKDHITRGNIDFSEMQTVILDEADRMLDMGFKDDIESILQSIKDACNGRTIQIGLFSATMPDEIREIALTYMREDFKEVDLTKDLTNKTAKNLKHLAIEVQSNNEMEKLTKILKSYTTTGKAIVFCETKAQADLVGKSLRNVKAGVMHGDIPQYRRRQVLDGLREDEIKVLIATSVAARGIDIKNVTLVVQMQPPSDTKDYTHRSGRTARAGASGTAVLFYKSEEEHKLDRLEEKNGIQFERVDDAVNEDE